MNKHHHHACSKYVPSPPIYLPLHPLRVSSCSNVIIIPLPFEKFQRSLLFSPEFSLLFFFFYLSNKCYHAKKCIYRMKKPSKK